jgi:uncharacterized RDD family membrane protein YckC
MSKVKITEIKETYTVKSRIRGAQTAADGSHFEIKTLVRYKEVITVEGWARFGHFLIDRIFFYILATLFAFLAGFVSAILGFPEVWESPYAGIVLNLITYLVVFPGYYLVFEYAMQSSPGKLILGRIVINEYGGKPTFTQILGRSYGRIVPFEAFSCFQGLGWHDSWTETMVIRKKDLYELNLALKVQDFGTEPSLQNN